MTARDVRREVDRERHRLADLERKIAVAETAYRAEASKPRVNVGPLSERYDEHAVSHARNRVAKLRAEHETTQIRIDALSAQLPSPEQVREAQPEAEQLLVQLRERDQRLAEGVDSSSCRPSLVWRRGHVSWRRRCRPKPSSGRRPRLSSSSSTSISWCRRRRRWIGARASGCSWCWRWPSRR